MKVKFAGRVYDVIETRTLPGGLVQYGIEDEPGHIDWLINVEIVDDGNSGYGFKSHGASYPTKPICFDGEPTAKQQMVCGYLVGAIAYMGRTPNLNNPSWDGHIDKMVEQHKVEFMLTDAESAGLKELTGNVLSFIRRLEGGA